MLVTVLVDLTHGGWTSWLPSQGNGGEILGELGEILSEPWIILSEHSGDSERTLEKNRKMKI